MNVSAAIEVRIASALRLAFAPAPPERGVFICEEERLVTASTCVSPKDTIADVLGLVKQSDICLRSIFANLSASAISASTVGFVPQLYCAFHAQQSKPGCTMSVRTLLLIILSVPALVLGGAAAFGMTIPVPQWGRDYVVRLALESKAPPFVLPEILGPDDPDRPLVVLDAGHGGVDPGSIGRGANGEQVLEKDIVLAITLELRDRLLEGGGIRVALTRSDDRIVTLSQRPEMARQLGADLFLSIHADSAGQRSDVGGASIYTLSNEASSEAAGRFAERENAADRLNGIMVDTHDTQVSAILVELSQERTQEDATEFAALIAREGEGEIRFHPQRRRSAALAVLRAPDVPGVLLESGFVTNEADRARLTTEQGRAQYAEVLARAIRVFFARRAEP